MRKPLSLAIAASLLVLSPAPVFAADKTTTKTTTTTVTQNNRSDTTITETKVATSTVTAPAEPTPRDLTYEVTQGSSLTIPFPDPGDHRVAGLPSWASADPHRVVLNPGCDVPEGPMSFRAYHGNTEDTYTILVKKASEATCFNHTIAQEAEVPQGETGKLPPPKIDGLPQGSRFEPESGTFEWAVVNPATGDVAISPTCKNAPGTYPIVYKVKFPDDSVRDIVRLVKVTESSICEPSDVEKPDIISNGSASKISLRDMLVAGTLLFLLLILAGWLALVLPKYKRSKAEVEELTEYSDELRKHIDVLNARYKGREEGRASATPAPPVPEKSPEPAEDLEDQFGEGYYDEDTGDFHPNSNFNPKGNSRSRDWTDPDSTREYRLGDFDGRD